MLGRRNEAWGPVGGRRVIGKGAYRQDGEARSFKKQRWGHPHIVLVIRRFGFFVLMTVVDDVRQGGRQIHVVPRTQSTLDVVVVIVDPLVVGITPDWCVWVMGCVVRRLSGLVAKRHVHGQHARQNTG